MPTRIPLLPVLVLCWSPAGAILHAQEEDARQEGDVVTQEELEDLTAEIKAEVAELREEQFQREVPVAVASEKEFREYVMKRMERDTTPEEIAAEETIAKMLGLIPADMDYVQTMLDMLEEQVGGFYDPDTEGFYLMERFGGDLAKIILAHELTHALDDQLYDIDGTLAELEGNADAQFAFHAVVEGSGTAVMNIWTLRHMSELDPAELLAAGEMGAEALEDAPPYLWKPLIAVYAKGSAFLNRTTNVMAGSMKLPDLEDFRSAFSAPPRSSEQILHPEKYWDAETKDEPVSVGFDTSGLAEGWSVIQEETFGELGLGLVVEPLKKRKGLKGQLAIMGTKYTYDASEGWGGDRYVLLGNGDARILVCETVWDSDADADELVAAVDELNEHLTGALAETARLRGLEGSGMRVVRGASGPDVGLQAWIGVDEETASSVISSLRVEISWKLPR